MGLGCMGMTGAHGAADEDESTRTVRTALDMGVTLFDTADVYGPFRGERLLGRALAGRRDEAIIASKFGGAQLDDEGNVTGGPTGAPAYVRRSVERALRHLRTDHIDLYYQHRVDPQVPVEETFGALSELVTAGKIRYLGIGEASVATIRRAHACAPLSAVQTEFSLFSRRVEVNGVLAATRELDIGFVASSPMGRGLLTRPLSSAADHHREDDLKFRFPRFEQSLFESNLRLLRQLEEIARSHRVSTEQAALAWLLGTGADIVAIPGTHVREHLREHVEAARLVWDGDQQQQLARATPPEDVAGDPR
ncbi:aldo/keto reductase [Streptomyces sp. NPDC002911]